MRLPTRATALLQHRDLLKDKDKAPHIIVGTPGRIKGVSARVWAVHAGMGSRWGSSLVEVLGLVLPAALVVVGPPRFWALPALLPPPPARPHACLPGLPVAPRCLSLAQLAGDEHA